MTTLKKKDIRCDECGIWDSSCIETDDNRLLCEDCWINEHFQMEECPICEDSWSYESMTEYFFISKDISKEVDKPIGLYKILKRPFYYGDCISGFHAFFDGAIERVSSLNITEVESIRNPRSQKEIMMDCICPDCAIKYTRKYFFIRAEPTYCILMKSEREKLFSEYSDKEIHHIRQELIHRRITFRGMLQQAINNKNKIK